MGGSITLARSGIVLEEESARASTPSIHKLRVGTLLTVEREQHHVSSALGLKESRNKCTVSYPLGPRASSN
jgi:hypothetical protein